MYVWNVSSMDRDAHIHNGTGSWIPVDTDRQEQSGTA